MTVFTKEVDDQSLVESEFDYAKGGREPTMYSDNMAYRETRAGMTEIPKSGQLINMSDSIRATDISNFNSSGFAWSMTELK